MTLFRRMSLVPQLHQREQYNRIIMIIIIKYCTDILVKISEYNLMI